MTDSKQKNFTGYDIVHFLNYSLEEYAYSADIFEQPLKSQFDTPSVLEDANSYIEALATRHEEAYDEYDFESDSYEAYTEWLTVA